jgi:hypothetical protein
MPPANKNKDKDKGDKAATRPNTRNRSSSVSMPEEFQDIKNAHNGRQFLERHSLLCPPGEPVSHEALSICLHQISALAGVPKQVVNAIRATAFLLEELEENTINETVKSAFDSQVTEFTSDMKLLIENVNTRIDDHLKNALTQIDQAAANIPTQAASSSNTNQDTTAITYASALVNPPPNVNPKLAAREGVRARQFLITGVKESTFGQYDTQKLKAEINNAARGLGLTEGKIRSLVTQNDGNVLIEVDSDAAVNWFTNHANRIELCGIMGDNVSFRTRIFNVLAYNAPLTIDPAEQKHVDELNEINDLEETPIAAIRWAKPMNRRSPQQRSAHLILSFLTPDAANRAITNGITICGKKCHIDRIKREPIRCLKCQGWNHMARDCDELTSKCSNCAERHRTSECRHPHSKRCVSCKSSDHASWSRECPTFLRKVDEYNERNPENLLPFFPTTDPWTWSTGNTNQSPPQRRPPVKRQGSSEPSRGHDVYLPSYGDRQNAQNHEPPPHDTWWDDNRIDSPAHPSQTTQNNTNNSGPVGPSNNTTYPNA